MTIRKKRFLCLYILMLALELLVAGFILTRFGFDFYQGGDSPGYMLLAQNLVEHGTLSFADASPYPPTNFRTPGYPLFLALIYLIFHSFVPAIFFGAIISAFSAPLIYLMAKEVFSENIAFGAGILTALEPMGLFLGVSILTEGVFTPILLLVIYLFIRYLKAGNNIYLYGSSVLLALATLIRPIMFYFWPLVVLFILYKESGLGLRPVLKKVFIFIAIFFIVLSPWLIRNKIVVNSWQITGLQGYIFFVDHYGAVLRYLGEAGPLSDVQNMIPSLLAPNKMFTSEGSDILFNSALSGIKQHKLAYANIYAKSMMSFFIANGYKLLFIDILGVPAKTPYIPLELFLRLDLKSIFKTFADMDFTGFLIYWGSKIIWAAIFLSFLTALVYLLFSKNYKTIRAEIIFIATVIFYFALITGPTVIGGGRTKAPVNGLIFIFVVFGFIKFYGFLRKKIA
ncbi:MAG: glycosyltransferase family 39 protein [Patescibacteria group bacterium]